MTLIFQTPSKRCPFRIFNGVEVTIEHLVGEKMVKRVGRRIPMYYVRRDDGLPGGWLAYGDELLIEAAA